MGNGYTRQSSGDIIDDNTIEASHFNTEFDAVQDAFNGSTGHSHDGTTGEGPLIGTLSPTVTSTSTDAGAAAGPIRTMYRNSASPAASDILGLIKFDGNDSGATQTTYASLQATIADPTDTSEDGTLDAYAMIGGSLTKVASFGDSIELRGTSVSATQFGYLGAMDQGVATADSVTFAGLSLTTDLAVTEGGTGASTASGARTNLGVAIGTDVQAYDANLAGINQGLATTDSVTFAGLSLTTDLAVTEGGTGASTASGARTNLGLVIGTDVQAYDANLAGIDQGLATTDNVTFNSVTTDTINEETAAAGVTIDGVLLKDSISQPKIARAYNDTDGEVGTFRQNSGGTNNLGHFFTVDDTAQTVTYDMSGTNTSGMEGIFKVAGTEFMRATSTGDTTLKGDLTVTDAGSGTEINLQGPSPEINFQRTGGSTSSRDWSLRSSEATEGDMSFFVGTSNTADPTVEVLRLDSSYNATLEGNLSFTSGGKSINFTDGLGNPYSMLLNGTLFFKFTGNSASNYDTYFDNGGAGNHNVSIFGALSKSSGSFKIDHVLEEKKDTHYLVHSFVESNDAINIYRGTVQLVNGQAQINLDTHGRMTEGTFVLLNRDLQCFTSNETGWDNVRGTVSGNILTIECQDGACTDTVSWMVIGERHDQHMMDTNWTDENGKVIVEPLKPQTDGA